MNKYAKANRHNKIGLMEGFEAIKSHSFGTPPSIYRREPSFCVRCGVLRTESWTVMCPMSAPNGKV